MLIETLQSAAEMRASNWNAEHPVGTPVIVTVNGIRVKVRTSSAAWSFNSRALVSCKSISSAVDLRDITPRFQCWVRMNRKGAANHWVPTTWDSEAECRKACEQVCKDDSRIESYDIRTDAPDSATD